MTRAALKTGQKPGCHTYGNEILRVIPPCRVRIVRYRRTTKGSTNKHVEWGHPELVATTFDGAASCQPRVEMDPQNVWCTYRCGVRRASCGVRRNLAERERELAGLSVYSMYMVEGQRTTKLRTHHICPIQSICSCSCVQQKREDERSSSHL